MSTLGRTWKWYGPCPLFLKNLGWEEGGEEKEARGKEEEDGRSGRQEER